MLGTVRAGSVLLAVTVGVLGTTVLEEAAAT